MKRSYAAIEAHYENEKTHLIQMTDQHKCMLIDLMDEYAHNYDDEGANHFFSQLCEQLENAK